MDAALRALRSDPGVSVAVIAAAAGVSRGTVYSHFASRDDLIDQVIARAETVLERQFDQLRAGVAPGDAMDVLAAGGTWGPGRVGGLERMPPRDGDESESAGWRMSARIRAVIERGRTDGSFRRDQSLGWQIACVTALARLGATRDAGPGRAEAIESVRAVLAARRDGE